MTGVFATTNESLLSAIDRDGFAFVHGKAMRDLVAAFGSLDDWDTFADSWSRLELDRYMADGGRYRRRRHGVFVVTGDRIHREAHQPHFQAIDYNPLNGGVARWFEPIETAVGSSQTLQTILAFCQSTFDRLAEPPDRKGGAWRVEVHQFRIEARIGQAGRPTPEGLHRDGVDYVLVLLIDRRNIASGVTTIYGLDGTPLGSFTLEAPLDAALVDDGRVAHGVTPVEAVDPSLPAHRDVLVVTFAAPSRTPIAAELP